MRATRPPVILKREASGRDPGTGRAPSPNWRKGAKGTASSEGFRLEDSGHSFSNPSTFSGSCKKNRPGALVLIKAYEAAIFKSLMA